MYVQHLHYEQHFLKQVILGQVYRLDIADHKQPVCEIDQCQHVQYVVGFYILQDAFDFINDATDGIPTLVSLLLVARFNERL